MQSLGLDVVRWFGGAFFSSALLIAAAFFTGLLYGEMQTSTLQARYLAGLGRELNFSLAAGPSPSIRFPVSGPFDERFGYAQLPVLLRELGDEFTIARQVRVSPRFAQLEARGINPPYREKSQAGLMVLDCENIPMFSGTYPERIYRNFEAIPRMLVETLLFIENRDLLELEYARKNPAVEWGRLGKALLDQVLHLFSSAVETSGASTLATQIEKFRHSPDGRTASFREKLRQMASASVRAYLQGENTTVARRTLVQDYLNTVPLAAKAGYGEVNGLGDGLWAWYGRDFLESNNLLADGGEKLATTQQRAEAYKQALSLMVAQRRPSYYLGDNASELEELCNSYLRLIARAGIITPALRDAALAAPLPLHIAEAAQPPQSFVTRKATTAVRTYLGSVLHTPRLYDLDRLDLTARSTMAPVLQKEVTGVLRDLRDRDKAAAAGLTGKQLLESSDPAKVIYSFTLFERGREANYLRIQTDNYDHPFDINAGAKLDLGSTAKFRTLVTYLEIVAALHGMYSGNTASQLRQVTVDPRDLLSRWALTYLQGAKQRGLEAMLEAAMDRRYSASPAEQFFTGGGVHSFENFHSEDNARVMTVREGFRNSVNLVFIRLIRDIVHHVMFNAPASSARVLASARGDPLRQQYLERFADREGQVFVKRFYRKYKGKTQREAETLLLQSTRNSAGHLTSIFRTIAPGGEINALRAFLATHLEAELPDAATLEALFANYAPERMSLADRAYVAGIHPLELWLVGYLRDNPDATNAQLTEASKSERIAVYKWLFSSHRKHAQDRRILSLLEVEAFLEIHRAWQRLGYPFDSLVPSYATALGTSADRPAALAELTGIIVNEGLRLPTVRLTNLHFGAGTPFETELERSVQSPERVLSKEVAAVVRRALIDVVEQGTARRLKGALLSPNGTVMQVGGKTGTGDHRFDTYGAHGEVLSSRVVNRSATFVFLIDKRYFGSITAFVPGPEAAKYHFTSALTVQLLKTLAPTLARLDQSCHPD